MFKKMNQIMVAEQISFQESQKRAQKRMASKSWKKKEQRHKDAILMSVIQPAILLAPYLLALGIYVLVKFYL